MNGSIVSYRFLVRVSYLEIYNEEVKDLLGKDLSARLEVGMAYVIVLLGVWAPPENLILC